MTKETNDPKITKTPAILKDQEIDAVQGGGGASGGPTPQVNKGKTLEKTEQGFVSIGGWDNHSG